MMKTIGLIGGMSWESTLSYYQIINEKTKEILGGLHSAKILLYSVDFAEIEEYQSKGEWDKSAEVLSDIAVNLEKAGADFIVICTNTMHKVVPQIADKISIPIIHIAKTTAKAIKRENLHKIALLGTKYTMTQDFYKQKLIDEGIEVIIPNQEDVEVVNDIIYGELCLGEINPISKQKYINIIDKLQKQGAQGVILGCTEIGLLISQADISLPVFDTTLIHAKEVASMAINE
ncbi:aspartate/glutamate racemase family protein [Tannockella kyphosi]|uniref:aspartate/glutamate racemase family protein n=1 Tax=Tannockella kyphosi TaxID=2899121 RepID=UPI0020134C57|nr:aspartate/glutamate racemase family protein [Tannockella kyphosi]